MTAAEIAVDAAVVVMVLAAIATAFVRDMTRLVISLGVFLVAVAFAFLALGSPLLAAAQVFVYVGGVLVLVLFAMMVLRRSGEERPQAASAHDIGAAATALGAFALLVMVLGPLAETPEPAAASVDAIAEGLLGPGLVTFELAGVLLLAAVLAIVVIVKGGSER